MTAPQILSETEKQVVFKMVCTPSRGQRNKSKNISSRFQIKVMLFQRCQNAKVTLETFSVVVMNITANHFHQFSTVCETPPVITLSLQNTPRTMTVGCCSVCPTVWRWSRCSSAKSSSSGRMPTRSSLASSLMVCGIPVPPIS